MQISREKLSQWASEQKLDMIGVADVKWYKDVAPQWNPLSILPTAKSIVVFGREIPRSSFRGVEEGTVFNRVNRYLAPVDAYTLCRRFEDNGILAVPCSPFSQSRWPDGIVFKEGKPAPNVTPDIYLAAQLAGLGEIGLNGLFITPQFGVRQALGLLFTDAEIPADEPFRTGTICDRLHCRACVDACPLHAITLPGRQTPVADMMVETARVQQEKCQFCANGVYADTSCETAPPNRMCAACNRACLAHLEDSGIVKTAFKKPFRRRDAWGFGAFEA